jgi:hypothetical protein
MLTRRLGGGDCKPRKYTEVSFGQKNVHPQPIHRCRGRSANSNSFPPVPCLRLRTPPYLCPQQAGVMAAIDSWSQRASSL